MLHPKALLMENGVLFGPQEIGNLFTEVKCANVLLKNDKANSFGKENTTDEMESGEPDQSKALGSRPKYPQHSVSVCSIAGQDGYDCLQKQGKAVETANNQHHNAHRKASRLEAMCFCVPVMSQASDGFGSHWWLSVVGVVELCTVGRVG